MSIDNWYNISTESSFLDYYEIAYDVKWDKKIAAQYLNPKENKLVRGAARTFKQILTQGPTATRGGHRSSDRFIRK